VELLEVSELIGQGLGKQLIVVLSGGNVLRENGVLFKPGVNIILVKPVVVAFVLHDLENPAPVYFSDVLIMQMLVEAGSEALIPHPPLCLIFVKAK
jgi:hypothetical protein